MRNLIVLFAVTVLMCSCQTKNLEKETTNKFMVGAYADFRSIAEDEMQLFLSTYGQDTELTPQSVATQVVAGTNYKFLCTDNANQVIQVVIFKPLPNQGVPQVVRVEPWVE